MRTTFVDILLEKAKTNKDIELLTGDLGFGVLKQFIDELPGQYTNCGIAEQNMLTMSGGMSSLGKCVVVYSIGNFPTLRAFEQIRNDICYYNHNVKIICIGGGFTYGSLGMSHHATEDIGVLMTLPNMNIFTPSDKIEARAVVNKMFEINGPCYLRLERDSANVYHENNKTINVDEPCPVLSFGSEFCVLTYGTIIDEIYDICLDHKVDLYTCPCLKPINRMEYIRTIKKYKKIFTVEEHSVIGGLGSIISTIIAENNCNILVKKIGIKDKFTSEVGCQKYLRKINHIDKESLEKIIVHNENITD